MHNFVVAAKAVNGGNRYFQPYGRLAHPFTARKALSASHDCHIGVVGLYGSEDAVSTPQQRYRFSIEPNYSPRHGNNTIVLVGADKSLDARHSFIEI